jgi:hypothetical protein
MNHHLCDEIPDVTRLALWTKHQARSSAEFIGCQVLDLYKTAHFPAIFWATDPLPAM